MLAPSSPAKNTIHNYDMIYTCVAALIALRLRVDSRSMSLRQVELESGAFRKWKEVACRILQFATSNEPVLQVSESPFGILGVVLAKWLFKVVVSKHQRLSQVQSWLAAKAPRRECESFSGPSLLRKGSGGLRFVNIADERWRLSPVFMGFVELSRGTLRESWSDSVVWAGASTVRGA